MKLQTVTNLQQTVQLLNRFIENVNITLPYSNLIITHIMVRMKLTYDYLPFFIKTVECLDSLLQCFISNIQIKLFLVLFVMAVKSYHRV